MSWSEALPVPSPPLAASYSSPSRFPPPMPVQVFVLGIVQILLSRTLLDRGARRSQALTQEGTWADGLSRPCRLSPHRLGG